MSEFCDEVEALVKEKYHLDDGGDLCWNLIESGVIDMKRGADVAAQTVAQHMEQA